MIEVYCSVLIWFHSGINDDRPRSNGSYQVILIRLNVLGQLYYKINFLEWSLLNQ